MTGTPKSSRPTNLLSIKESRARQERPMTGLGIWRLGFRPFYLGASLLSSLAIFLWLSTLAGIESFPNGQQPSPLLWHAHEMVFGFAFAVIAGFLLTASNNWTGILPAAGQPLAALFCLWGIARISIALGAVYVAAGFDLLFAGLLSLLLFRVLWLAKLWRNFLILGMVVLIGLSNAWFYIRLVDGTMAEALYSIELALLLMLQLLVIMGGRVIPMFTQNGVQGISVWRPDILVKLTPITSALGIIAWLMFPSRLATVFCLIGCLVNLIRWLGWKPWRTLQAPMVWVLQLGYLWIPVTFLLMGLESLGLVSRSMPIHALGVGALGLIVAGMITRTARGHTGRMIAPSGIDKGFFLLLAIASVTRVIAAAPFLQGRPDAFPLLAVSGTCWGIGFMAYLYQYTPWLFKPRIDGRPG